MGVLSDFERRLEGAVEGFFARTFRSGLQPVELARGVRRYAAEHQHVTEDGVVIPNVYRIRLHSRDVERLQTYGERLERELAEVVVRTAAERGWRMRGPALVEIEDSDSVAFGTYELAGKVDSVAPDAPGAVSPTEATAPVPAATAVRIVRGGETGRRFILAGDRVVVGRRSDCAIRLDDPTVSREHAALLRRDGSWWVVDLGSTNGTLVNGTRATERVLRHGDRIELGEAVLELVED